MYRSVLQEDPHTDYFNNWIERAIKNTLLCLRLTIPEPKIIEILQKNGCPDDELSLILVSAKMLYADEMAGK